MVFTWRQLTDQGGLLDSTIRAASQFSLRDTSRKGGQSNCVGYSGCFRWEGWNSFRLLTPPLGSSGPVGTSGCFWHVRCGIGYLSIRRFFGESPPQVPLRFLARVRPDTPRPIIPFLVLKRCVSFFVRYPLYTINGFYMHLSVCWGVPCSSSWSWGYHLSSLSQLLYPISLRRGEFSVRFHRLGSDRKDAGMWVPTRRPITVCLWVVNPFTHMEFSGRPSTVGSRITGCGRDRRTGRLESINPRLSVRRSLLPRMLSIADSHDRTQNSSRVPVQFLSLAPMYAS